MEIFKFEMQLITLCIDAKKDIIKVGNYEDVPFLKLLFMDKAKKKKNLNLQV